MLFTFKDGLMSLQIFTMSCLFSCWSSRKWWNDNVLSDFQLLKENRILLLYIQCYTYLVLVLSGVCAALNSENRLKALGEDVRSSGRLPAQNVTWIWNIGGQTRTHRAPERLAKQPDDIWYAPQSSTSGAAEPKAVCRQICLNPSEVINLDWTAVSEVL